MSSIIVITAIGATRRIWPPADNILPVPAGFAWRYVPEAPFAAQVRSILRLNASAVVVWVGDGDAVHRAAETISRLLETGPPILIAILEAPDAASEALLRQAGALSLCIHEADLRLASLLRSALKRPASSKTGKDTGFSPEVKLDAG
jgi:hypothetical protein